MTYHEISDRVQGLYELLLENPLMFADRGSIEQVAIGIETVLNAVAGTNNRIDSYRSFLQERSFGMFPFDSKFESRHHCIISFIDTDKYRIDPSCSELHEAYVREFAVHWKDFLEWRKQRISAS